jgi:hypothetical protein
MKPATRAFTILVGAVLVLVLGSSFLLAGSVVTGSLVTISVHEREPDGIDLYLPVPAGLVEATLTMAPVVFSALGDRHLEHEFEQLRLELDEMLPAIEAILAELEDLPSATLVEVEGSGESVRVSKVRGAIQIRVEEDGTRVNVTVPTRVFRAVGGFLTG